MINFDEYFKIGLHIKNYIDWYHKRFENLNLAKEELNIIKNHIKYSKYQIYKILDRFEFKDTDSRYFKMLIVNNNKIVYYKLTGYCSEKEFNLAKKTLSIT